MIYSYNCNHLLLSQKKDLTVQMGTHKVDLHYIITNKYIQPWWTSNKIHPWERIYSQHLT